MNGVTCSQAERHVPARSRVSAVPTSLQTPRARAALGLRRSRYRSAGGLWRQFVGHSPRHGGCVVFASWWRAGGCLVFCVCVVCVFVCGVVFGAVGWCDVGGGGGVEVVLCGDAGVEV
jgi:hypothetical protein